MATRSTREGIVIQGESIDRLLATIEEVIDVASAIRNSRNAELLKKDPELEKQLRASNYLIGIIKVIHKNYCGKDCKEIRPE